MRWRNYILDLQLVSFVTMNSSAFALSRNPSVVALWRKLRVGRRPFALSITRLDAYVRVAP